MTVFTKAMQLARGPKRQRRIKATRAEWDAIIAAKTGPCRCCSGASGLTVSHHHVVPKGSPWFGDDVADNIVPVCGSGTTGCHGHVENRDRSWMLSLVASLTDSERAYALSRAGETFFERRYGVYPL